MISSLMILYCVAVPGSPPSSARSSEIPPELLPAIRSMEAIRTARVTCEIGTHRPERRKYEIIVGGNTMVVRAQEWSSYQAQSGAHKRRHTFYYNGTEWFRVGEQDGAAAGVFRYGPQPPGDCPVRDLRAIIFLPNDLADLDAGTWLPTRRSAGIATTRFIMPIIGVAREFDVDATGRVTASRELRPMAGEQPDAPLSAATIKYRTIDGIVFPSQITIVNNSEPPGVDGTFSVIMAEFNRSSHKRKLNEVDAGFEFGIGVNSGLPGKAKESREYWLGPNDYAKRDKFEKLLVARAIPPPLDIPAADRKKLTLLNGDPYIAAAMAFSQKHKLTDPQRLAAEGVAVDVRNRHKQLTARDEMRSVVASELLPRLQAMLTTQQAASAPTRKRQRAEGPAASQPRH